MLKNRMTLIIVAVVVIILLAGGYFLFLNKSVKETPREESQTTRTGPQNLDAEDIGLELSLSPDKKKVRFKIDKLEGISSIDYELTYEADTTAQERSEGGEDRIQRGIQGDAKFKSSDKSYQSPWLDLGSCSKNVCRYDNGIADIHIILNITKGGKSYSAEKTLNP